MPGGGGPGTEDGSAGLPDLLHAGGLPEYAGCLPLPREQGKAVPPFFCAPPTASTRELSLGRRGANLASTPECVTLVSDR